jgi:hypothetical protein
VDKTGFALRLIAEGAHYFLARPRRFGKSLFLDTLAELFESNAALFAGLAAEHRWGWSRRFPVIRLSFAEGVLADRQALDRRIEDLLRTIAASSTRCSIRSEIFRRCLGSRALPARGGNEARSHRRPRRAGARAGVTLIPLSGSANQRARLEPRRRISSCVG